MPVLRTATGKEFYCNFMGVASSMVLYVKILLDLAEVLEIFQDPNETRILQWFSESGELVREERGFTIFKGFELDDGACPVRVRMDRDIEFLIAERMNGAQS